MIERDTTSLQDRVLSGVVDVILPAEPVLADDVRRRVAADAARFVSLQVGNIPTFLRVPYRFAILGFEWLPLLRYGRPFRGLSPERKLSYLALWSDGPVGVTRDFVRLIRNCALLKYFDHPEVRRVLDEQRRVAMTQRRLQVGAE